MFRLDRIRNGDFRIAIWSAGLAGLAGRLSDSIEWVSIVFAAISLRQICITIADCNLSPNKLAAAPAPASVWTPISTRMRPKWPAAVAGRQ